MTEYAPPIQDMKFVLEAIAGLDRVAALPGYEDVSADLVDAVLEQAGRLASEVLAPLNLPGDQEGSRLENGIVYTPGGWREAYATFAAGGWNAIAGDPAYGGQGLPRLLATPAAEMWSAANMALALCPMLSEGVVELISAHGSADQKETYLPHLVAGEWTGTMNLTEPQAGSDLAAIRTRAVPEGDHYRLKGQKIFITYGDHDLTENIVHMVLARTPDAPDGVRGISLFIVPKMLSGPDSQLGERNDLRCVSLEHKMGIHASPTAVLAYGDNEGAIGYLVGEENRGLEYMFTMMNNERLAVGLQGVAIADRAYQKARAHAMERIQGRDMAAGSTQAVAIIQHPDVRRMLMSMKSQTEAMRALAYFVAASLDAAKRHPDAAPQSRYQALVDFLTPVVKAWCTDVGCEIASLGIQVHGGMGYIEETGAAQFYRDGRITCIYEGTNGIQARDLVGRKLLREGGETARALLAEMQQLDDVLCKAPGDNAAVIRAAFVESLRAVEQATTWLIESGTNDPLAAAAGAAPYLRLVGTVAGGWLMARAALAALAGLSNGNGDRRFLESKIVTARFYADHILPQATALLTPITRGASSVMALDIEQF